ncbi:hypothetical protein NEOC95_000663 [Neochlamydia sp. AcF95]|nr:hypothetical protein [Neochlamydia sp. AcF95]
MKDFYDIWLLIQQLDFDRDELQAIIQQIIKNCGTIVKSSSLAFEKAFYNHSLKQDQWKAFLKGRQTN